jgi:hypothetical protein
MVYSNYQTDHIIDDNVAKNMSNVRWEYLFWHDILLLSHVNHSLFIYSVSDREREGVLVVQALDNAQTWELLIVSLRRRNSVSWKYQVS